MVTYLSNLRSFSQIYISEHDAGWTYLYLKPGGGRGRGCSTALPHKQSAFQNHEPREQKGGLSGCCFKKYAITYKPTAWARRCWNQKFLVFRVRFLPAWQANTYIFSLVINPKVILYSEILNYI